MKLRPAPPTPDPSVICPTPEHAQHDALEVGERMDDDGNRTWGARNVTQKPLDRYLRCGEISSDQFQAGMMLYRHWRAAGRQPRLIADYRQKTDRPFDNPADRREIARRAYMDALNALPGVFVSIVQAVALLDETASEWATKNRRSRHGALDYLRDALELLHEHYRAQYQRWMDASSAEH